MSEWISVKDRLPDVKVMVLVFDETFIKSDSYDNKKGYGAFRAPGVRFGYLFESGNFRSEGVNGFSKITHWMPLPAPPTTKAKGGE